MASTKDDMHTVDENVDWISMASTADGTHMVNENVEKISTASTKDDTHIENEKVEKISLASTKDDTHMVNKRNFNFELSESGAASSRVTLSRARQSITFLSEQTHRHYCEFLCCLSTRDKGGEERLLRAFLGCALLLLVLRRCKTLIN